MEEKFPDPSGPPYPYPEPLPPAAKQAHLEATRHYQRRINKWNGFVFMPGVIVAVCGAFWGMGRSSKPGETLWETNLQLALILVGVGAALIAVGGAQVYRIAKAKSPHTKLLKAYGVQLDPTGSHAP